MEDASLSQQGNGPSHHSLSGDEFKEEDKNSEQEDLVHVKIYYLQILHKICKNQSGADEFFTTTSESYIGFMFLDIEEDHIQDMFEESLSLNRSYQGVLREFQYYCSVKNITQDNELRLHIKNLTRLFL